MIPRLPKSQISHELPLEEHLYVYLKRLFPRSMFLELIIDIHAGLSMCEMSMMGMTQIGAQVIIIRKNINKKYYASQNKKSSQIRIALG